VIAPRSLTSLAGAVASGPMLPRPMP